MTLRLRLRWTRSQLAGDRRRPSKRPPTRRRGSAAQALATARAWARQLASDGISRADLARKHRISRARVTQLLALLDLHPGALYLVERDGGATPSLSERRLRAILAMPGDEQVAAVHALLERPAEDSAA